MKKLRKLRYSKVIILHILHQKNIDDERAKFRWASLDDIKNLKARFNHVICNPPFHSGRLKDMDLIRSFIFHSTRLITDHGSVWMVFVSGVYSENKLRNYFDKIKIVYKDNHYFVCQLLKPKIKR